MMKQTKNLKNTLLSLTYFIGLLPKLFYGTDQRMWLSILHAREFTTRLDFVVLYYTNTINFLILAYCIHFPKGIDKRLSNFILWICTLDLVHLFLYAKQDFGITKVFLAFSIVMGNEFYKKYRRKR